MTLKNSDDNNIFSDNYLRYVKDVNKEIKKVLSGKVAQVNEELAGDANRELRKRRQGIIMNGINEYQEWISSI